MERIAPVGDVYQAGTLSGNPVATTAGLATLRLATPDVYAQLDHTDGGRERLDQIHPYHPLGVTPATLRRPIP